MDQQSIFMKPFIEEALFKRILGRRRKAEEKMKLKNIFLKKI